MVLLGGDAGLRCGGIIGLECTDLDFRRSVICVQRSEWRGHLTTPKGGRSREVPMTARLAALLKGQPAPSRTAGAASGRRNQGTARRALVLDGKGAEASEPQSNRRSSHLEAHVLRPACDAGSTDDGDQGAGRTRGHLDHSALHHLTPATKNAAIRLLEKGALFGDVVETGVGEISK